MQEMSRRNQHFTDSVIRRMTRISNECGAINLAQGFPDFDPPKEMMDRLEVVSHEGPHQYPITMGAPNTAVTELMLTSVGAKAVRAMRSQSRQNAAPPRQQPGRT